MCRRCFPTPTLLREVSRGVLGAKRTAPGTLGFLRGWMWMEPGRGQPG